MSDAKIIPLTIPMMGDPDGPGWRLRPKGHDHGIEDRDPRGKETGVDALGIAPEQRSTPNTAYVELHCHTCYSFREGASTPRELVEQAAALGYTALALTDRDGLYGAMEFAKAAEAVGVRPIIGADVTLQGGYQLVLLAETREGYANICRLLSGAHLAEARETAIRPEIPNPRIELADLARHTEGLIVLSGDAHGEVPSLIAAGQYDRAAAAARRYASWFGPDQFFIELQQTLTLGDTERNHALMRLARQLGLGVVATNDVWYHVRERHRLHDVLVAIKHRSTLDGSHRLRHANSEHYLKSADEIAELFDELSGVPVGRVPNRELASAGPGGGGQAPALPHDVGNENGATGMRWDKEERGLGKGERDLVREALRNSVVIAERCRFDLLRDLGYEFPHYPTPPGETPDTHLARICAEALERKYPRATNHHRGEAEARIEEELVLIRKHGLAGFFLAYYDLLGLAGEIAGELKGRDPHLPPDERPVGRGRGSSVSSIVCYLIGLSHIDPIANELFLGRFLNEEMHSIPDIDLDFPRDVREELLKRIWTVFDQGKAALVCAYSTYHGRSAVRDVGKALGLPALELDHLAKLSDAWSSEGIAHEMARLPEYQAKLDAPLWRDLVVLTQQIIGLPRHITQHVGGVVISACPLQDIVPLEPTRMEGRVMCQWDKDAVDDARMVKIDFLALGMLSLVDECLGTIEQRHGERPDLGRIRHDDPVIYDKICAGDTIGLFQIESRAQIATLPHTQPRTLDDLAVQVAIVRPGPIVGGAFRPYMEYRRRAREGEPIDVYYIHPFLEPVLKDTLGVVLYQEQVVQVAMAIAGYSAGEADQLRRNLSRRRGGELVEKDWPAFRERAGQRGVPEDAAMAAFRSILGFASYGFPKSHAVAFGLLAFESAWLRYHFPAEYYAALFNNQPMGFYSTEVLAGDARRHGLELARPDINLSGVGCTVETDRRIRLGLGEVKGVGTNTATMLVAEREANGFFRSLHDCADRTGLKPEALESLILAGAFDGAGEGARSPSRRELLWQLGLLRSQKSVLVASRRPVAYRQRALPLPIEQDMVALSPMSAWEQVAAEYEILGLSPEQHVMALLRRGLDAQILTSAQAVEMPDDSEVLVAGLVVCRQRPSTAKGVLFVSLEDEFGIANLVVWPRLLERQRTLILSQAFLVAQGRVQRQGTVVHIVARNFYRPDVRTDRLIAVSHDFR